MDEHVTVYYIKNGVKVRSDGASPAHRAHGQGLLGNAA